MRLLLNAETERDLALWLDGANDDATTDGMLEEAGANWTKLACRWLSDHGHEFSRAHSQSVGSFVICQTPTKSHVWHQALEDTRGKAQEYMTKMVEQARLAV
jgi:hypothetical protein